jgi:hypothetical protein
MTDYEFRANRINNDIIVYGLLTYHNDEICIITEDNNKYFIKENTIQEYTRLKDKNKNKVFVGDKLKHFEGREFEIVFNGIKGILLSEINGMGEYGNGYPFWIDDCEIIY